MDCWSPSLYADDEFEKLIIRMNPPRVTVDNASSRKATLIKVDSANKRGSLLAVVQVLTDLNLIIKRAYISSDGEWFMDVFHVTDQHGNKLPEDDIAERIQQSLGPRALSFRSLRRSVGVQAAVEHTTIELTGRDRPGLLSEVFAVLANLKCNVVAAEVWTHNSRMASVVYITDEETGLPIDDPERQSKIKQLLLYVLKGDRDKRSANTAVSLGSTHTERRLHQMMYAYRDYDADVMECGSSASDRSKPFVTVENLADKGYTVVNLRCQDRPKLLFDTICSMLYSMQQSTPKDQKLVRNIILDIRMAVPLAPKQRDKELSIAWRLPSGGDLPRHEHTNSLKFSPLDGIRLELCGDDRVGLLSDVTRIFRENGLSVTRAEVTTRGSQAVNVFYVTDSSGNSVRSETIEAIRKEIGLTILHVKDDEYSKSPPQESGRFSLGNLFRSRSEKFLYSLGLIKSYS
ncbi:ACT domain [Dillenia turbinata]|uniref:ACT domain-containing protein ACR n=1 Tax=Dillenia turbinata TaxID=194707 RepID=A0AAN8VIZ2_9MAGN